MGRGRKHAVPGSRPRPREAGSFPWITHFAGGTSNGPTERPSWRTEGLATSPTELTQMIASTNFRVILEVDSLAPVKCAAYVTWLRDELPPSPVQVMSSSIKSMIIVEIVSYPPMDIRIYA